MRRGFRVRVRVTANYATFRQNLLTMLVVGSSIVGDIDRLVAVGAGARHRPGADRATVYERLLGYCRRAAGDGDRACHLSLELLAAHLELCKGRRLDDSRLLQRLVGRLKWSVILYADLNIGSIPISNGFESF